MPDRDVFFYYVVSDMLDEYPELRKGAVQDTLKMLLPITRTSDPAADVARTRRHIAGALDHCRWAHTECGELVNEPCKQFA